MSSAFSAVSNRNRFDEGPATESRDKDLPLDFLSEKSLAVQA